MKVNNLHIPGGWGVATADPFAPFGRLGPGRLPSSGVREERGKNGSPGEEKAGDEVAKLKEGEGRRGNWRGRPPRGEEKPGGRRPAARGSRREGRVVWARVEAGCGADPIPGCLRCGG